MGPERQFIMDVDVFTRSYLKEDEGYSIVHGRSACSRVGKTTLGVKTEKWCRGTKTAISIKETSTRREPMKATCRTRISVNASY